MKLKKNILSEYCRINKHSIVCAYADEGTSGKDILHRTAFKQLLNDAQARKFDCVLVWKITRLTRSLKDLVFICETLEKFNVSLISYSEAFDANTSSGRMIRNLLGVIAQWEREIISENIKIANIEKISQGIHLCSCALGYDSNRRELIVNEKEADIVREIFYEYLKSPCLSLVANKLNQKNYKGKKGCKFTPQSVLTILTNPLYCGYNRHNGMLYKGNHASIITVDTYNAVQRLIVNNQNGRHRQNKLNIIQ
ncbi:MAG: recombinase family protein [Acutalibacteraceae bacterium]|nr:recombinase family protein [Acutalibacteraceae bacterium]